MTRTSLILLLGVLGCCPITSLTDPSSNQVRKPSRWILVSRPYDELGSLSRAGEAKVAPDSSALVLVPVYEDHRKVIFPSGRCPHSLTVRYSQVRRVGVGETVEVDVKLEGGDVGRHSVEIRPTRKDVNLITPDESVVGPGETLLIRFTASSPGVGGVAIRILECTSSE